jgi:hypothetical protein
MKKLPEVQELIREIGEDECLFFFACFAALAERKGIARFLG